MKCVPARDSGASVVDHPERIGVHSVIEAIGAYREGTDLGICMKTPDIHIIVRKIERFQEPWHKSA